MQTEESISGYYKVALEDIRADVLSRADEYLLGVNVEEYSEYLCNRFEFPKIRKDPEREITVIKENAWKEATEFGWQVRYEIIVARIEYPIVHHRLIEHVLFRSSTQGRLGSHRFDYFDGTITLRSLPEDIENDIRELEELFGWKNADVETGNRQIKESIAKLIKERINKIRQDKEAFEKAVQRVNIPIRIRNHQPIPVLDFKVKKELRVLMAPNAERAKEFILKKSTSWQSWT